MGWGVHDYPSPTEDPEVICPVCGCDCRTYYRTLNGEIVGCDECIETVDAIEWQQEQADVIAEEYGRIYLDE